MEINVVFNVDDNLFEIPYGNYKREDLPYDMGTIDGYKKILNSMKDFYDFRKVSFEFIVECTKMFTPEEVVEITNEFIARTCFHLLCKKEQHVKFGCINVTMTLFKEKIVPEYRLQRVILEKLIRCIILGAWKTKVIDYDSGLDSDLD